MTFLSGNTCTRKSINYCGQHKKLNLYFPVITVFIDIHVEFQVYVFH